MTPASYRSGVLDTRRAGTPNLPIWSHTVPNPETTPAEAAVQALADINTVWSNWTSGRLDSDDAMTAIRDHLTAARELGALK